MSIILLSLILLFPCYSWAGTYYVSPTGAATWANCEDAAGTPGPKEGTAACSVATMNAGAKSAGDVIYFRAGDYNYSTQYGLHINLDSDNGSTGNLITLQNYNSEVVNFIGTYGTDMSGLVITNSSYIKVSGLSITDYARSIRVTKGSHHIELTGLTVKTDTSPYRGIGGIQFDEDCGAGQAYHCPVSHIWFHDNTAYKLMGGGGCTSVISEGGDLLRIGYTSITVGLGYSTSVTENAIDTGEKTFTVQSGKTYTTGHKVRVRYDADNYMVGLITSYSDTTLVVDVSSVTGSGTYSSWDISTYAQGLNSNITIENNTLYHGGHAIFDNYGIYSVVRNNKAHNEPWYPKDNGECTVKHEPVYTNAAYDDLYSHRIFQITDTFDRDKSFNLYEENRLGIAGVNPNNDGATGLTIASPGNIIRYNDSFGAMHNPMKTKYGDGYGWQASGGTRNRIYNNTLYKGGYGYPYFQTCTNPPDTGCPKPLVGFRWYAPSDNSGNDLKNNIVYGSYGAVENSSEDIQDCTSDPNSTYSNNWCTNADAGKCTGTGDPLFTSTDLSDPTSLTLPNLALQSGSPAIDGGTYLTTVHADDTSSGTSLILTDALYFQDGTWGSSLSTVAADWICVGATLAAAECFQIGAINYTTNTITVADFTREDGDKVWLYKKSDGTQVLYGNAPDYGAHESNHTATGSHRGLSIGGGVSIR